MRRALALLGFAALLGCGGGGTDPGTNLPPVIREFIVRPASTVQGGSVRATGIAVDPEGAQLTVTWSARVGSLSPRNDFTTNWTAPDSSGVFTLIFRASDGANTVTDSVQVSVGNASLTVVTNPPGASIVLDGQSLFEKSPVTLGPLAPGAHTLTVSHPFFAFANPGQEVILADGDADTVRFNTSPANLLELNTGRTDLLETGGVAFLASGFGYLFSARTASGTVLVSSALNPLVGNGRILATGVRLTEPLAVSDDGAFVAWVDSTGALFASGLVDVNNDGLIESLSGKHRLANELLSGPAFGSGSRLAFTVTPSTEDPGQPPFWAFFANNALSPWQVGSSRVGRVPSWEPNGDRLAFDDRGAVYTSLSTGGSATLLAARDGFRFSSAAWGRWGSGHIAFLGGPESGATTDVFLSAVGSPGEASVRGGLTHPRFLSWSPLQRSLLVTDNPGRGRVLLLSNFPFP